MPWVVLYVLVGVVGLALLAICGFRVFVAVGQLSREVRRTEERLEPSLLALEQATNHIHSSHR